MAALWICAYDLPSLLKDVRDACSALEQWPKSVGVFQQLHIRSQQLRERLEAWHDVYLQQRHHHSTFDQDAGLEITLLCLAGVIISNRLLLATNPAGDDASSTEDETQSIAHHALDLIAKAPEGKRHDLLAGGTKMEAAKFAIISQGSWRHLITIAKMSGDVGPILKEVMGNWPSRQVRSSGK